MPLVIAGDDEDSNVVAFIAFKFGRSFRVFKEWHKFVHRLLFANYVVVVGDCGIGDSSYTAAGAITHLVAEEGFHTDMGRRALSSFMALRVSCGRGICVVLRAG